MDEFHINFNIFGKYSDFNSWQKAEFLSPVKKSMPVMTVICRIISPFRFVLSELIFPIMTGILYIISYIVITD